MKKQFENELSIICDRSLIGRYLQCFEHLLIFALKTGNLAPLIAKYQDFQSDALDFIVDCVNSSSDEKETLPFDK